MRDVTSGKFEAIITTVFASAQKCFLRSYSGFRPFFGILFLAHNSKTAGFSCILSILRSHYFSNSYQMAYSLFWWVDLFWKLFLLLEFILPVLLWVWRGQKKYICFEKPLNVMTRHLLDGTDFFYCAKMAKSGAEEVWLKPVISPKSDWLKIIGLFSGSRMSI